MQRKSVFLKNIYTVIFFALSSLSLPAQYYYKDITGTRDINQTIQLYLKNKVVSVEATGYDNENTKDGDFSETHDFFAGSNLLKISTRNKTDISNEYYRFNSQGQLLSVSDTSASAISTTTYRYDNKNNPVTITNEVIDSADSVYENEVHQWLYNAEGKPEKMLRIVNKNDTTDVRFSLDDKGNVIEELPFIKKISREKTYYYYDSKNRLTDIVRFNIKAGRLLPDYLFEYSDKDQVTQKITTLSAGDVGYLIWRYVYDNNGLKTTEASFNRNKELTGKIQYRYRLAE